uniref:tRNA methyltransferase O n=1 Tax=Esox lucius TaxID=8010 RepID=A0AAY5L7L1_ESOLU
MSATCNSADHFNKLQQQISVMRKEIKNLRQLLDSAVRSHRKHMTSLQSALTHTGQDAAPKRQPIPQTERMTQNSLEKGTIQTVPIGYISSCFSAKNGTPRQPTICGPSRATLQIRRSVFNNPEHSLIGLENYSHVWVVFLFHENGHLSYKAKVTPPRLNGQKVGVYSTRSPHRPNALGLTLAKLDKVAGCNQPRFKFLRGPKEAASAIQGILAADPRSVYRRSRCVDRLFFFTLDTADITCWFGPGFAEVL